MSTQHAQKKLRISFRGTSGIKDVILKLGGQTQKCRFFGPFMTEKNY